MIALSRALLAASAAVLLPPVAGCAPEADAPVPEASGAAAGLTVTNARVVLAPVGGNPAAVYLDLSYSGPAGVTLDAVAVEGAGMTMLHDYAEDAGKKQMVMVDAVPLAKGAPVSLAPGGLHVMVMEPSEALKPGGTAQITLTLSNGTAATIEAPVRAAGEER